MIRTYHVTVTRLREFSATIAIRARSQAEADRAALAAFYKWACDEGCQTLFPPPWKEHESVDHEPKIDTTFRCVDCGKDTGQGGEKSGEYYCVGDDVWAASGLAPNGGMLCLACLERRIKRPLTPEDFEALWPDASAWQRHIAARVGCADPGRPPEQLEIWQAAKQKIGSLLSRSFVDESQRGGGR
jgi:hypothetical protein